MSFAKADMLCWKCGHKLPGILLPLSRQEECPQCHSDLHTCRSCLYFNSNAVDGCEEDRADFTLEKDKANFCEYLSINPNAYAGSDGQEAEIARAKLAEIFGDTPGEQKTEATDQGNTKGHETDADKALAELNRLFSDD